MPWLPRRLKRHQRRMKNGRRWVEVLKDVCLYVLLGIVYALACVLLLGGYLLWATDCEKRGGHVKGEAFWTQCQ